MSEFKKGKSLFGYTWEKLTIARADYRKRPLTPEELAEQNRAKEALRELEGNRFAFWDSGEGFRVDERDYIMEPVPEFESNQAETPTSDLPRQ